MAPAAGEGNGEGTHESTWLGRTHFSRSICYRLNSRPLSGLSVPFFEDNKPKGFVKLVGKDPENQLGSQGLLANGTFESSNILHPTKEGMVASVFVEDIQPLYASSSVDTSPGGKIGSRGYGRHRRSLSLPSTGSRHHQDHEEDFYSSEEYSDDGTKLDGSQLDVARACRAD